jgi:predicted RNA-binding protein YlqC (UPF0109 family)
MQELLTYIVQSIVQHPESVDISQVISEDGSHITLRLSVHPDDMGIIIGKEGNVARSLRNIVKVLAAKSDKRVYIDILETSGEHQTES